MVSNEPPPLPDGALDAALAPFGRSTMLPPQAYTDPAVFAWEQQHLLGGWQCVAMSADLPEPGDQRARIEEHLLALENQLEAS